MILTFCPKCHMQILSKTGSVCPCCGFSLQKHSAETPAENSGEKNHEDTVDKLDRLLGKNSDGTIPL